MLKRWINRGARRLGEAIAPWLEDIVDRASARGVLKCVTMLPVSRGDTVVVEVDGELTYARSEKVIVGLRAALPKGVGVCLIPKDAKIVTILTDGVQHPFRCSVIGCPHVSGELVSAPYDMTRTAYLHHKRRAEQGDSDA